MCMYVLTVTYISCSAIFIILVSFTTLSHYYKQVEFFINDLTRKVPISFELSNNI